jgi:hypothetical protein
MPSMAHQLGRFDRSDRIRRRVFQQTPVSLALERKACHDIRRGRSRSPSLGSDRSSRRRGFPNPIHAVSHGLGVQDQMTGHIRPTPLVQEPSPQRLLVPRPRVRPQVNERRKRPRALQVAGLLIRMNYQRRQRLLGIDGPRLRLKAFPCARCNAQVRWPPGRRPTVGSKRHGPLRLGLQVLL